MRLKIKDRVRAWRRSALAPVNRGYGRVKRAIQSFIIKTVTIHGPRCSTMEAAPVNTELLLSLFKATQRPTPISLPALQAIPAGEGRLLTLHPLAGFMYVGTHDAVLLPQVVLSTYQQRQTAALEHEIMHGERVLHLGAGQGYHTLSLAKLVTSDGSITAVSTDPMDRAILQTNVAAHVFGRVVAVHASLHEALCDSAEPDMVYVTDGYRVPHAWIDEIAALLHRSPATRLFVGTRQASVDELSQSAEKQSSLEISRRAA